MLDIDHFKTVNDCYGHQVGDDVLVSLSRLIQQRVRDVDCIGRYGGEEFVLLLPGASVQDAQIIAGRLRLAIANQPFEAGKNTFHITVSQGITACQAQSGMNLDGLLKKADQALYAAKKAGRNCVVVST